MYSVLYMHSYYPDIPLGESMPLQITVAIDLINSSPVVENAT